MFWYAPIHLIVSCTATNWRSSENFSHISIFHFCFFEENYYKLQLSLAKKSIPLWRTPFWLFVYGLSSEKFWAARRKRNIIFFAGKWHIMHLHALFYKIAVKLHELACNFSKWLNNYTYFVKLHVSNMLKYI